MEEDEMGGTCSRNGGDEKCVQKLAGNPEGKRHLERFRRRWQHNIKMKIKE
jgi:hypothetical protein